MQYVDPYNMYPVRSPFPVNPCCPVHGNRMYQSREMYRQIMIEDAIDIARKQVPGQVVQAELENKSGRLIYEVDVITSESVKYEVKIDANTGEVIEVELD